jgi:hypothetical protein
VHVAFFQRSEGWAYHFLEADVQTSVGRIRACSSADLLRDLIDRTPTKLGLSAKQSVESAFRNGRDGLWLELTQERYGKL